MSGRLLLLMLVLVLAPLLIAGKRPSGLGDVGEVRTWSYPNYTRVVVELSRRVEVKPESLVRLPANPDADRPERLYLDLEGIWVGQKYGEGVQVGDGLLRGVRLGQNTLTRSRLVIDLERYERHRMFTLSGPDRVVVDVYGARRERPRMTRKPKNGERGPGQRRRMSMDTRPLHTVVIDPGHGGRDPGAIGRGGLREKDVNLTLAKLLARRLRARSFRVVMTRTDDRYVDLEERTVVAESSGGDLFVSLHANASRRSSLRGLEIYHLDQNSGRHSVEVAARENGVPKDQVDGLQRALAHLRVSEAGVHSQHLAEYVHHDIREGLGVTYPGLPDLGVKKGPFYVLFMSSMPSILIESGFVTNKYDAKLLRSERFLDTLAQQIAAGLGHYRNSGRGLTLEARRSDSGLPPVGAR